MSNPSDTAKIKNRELMAGCCSILQESFHLLDIEQRLGRAFVDETAREAGVTSEVAALRMLTAVLAEALFELENKLKPLPN